MARGLRLPRKHRAIAPDDDREVRGAADLGELGARAASPTLCAVSRSRITSQPRLCRNSRSALSEEAISLVRLPTRATRRNAGCIAAL
jgi:hypothetical protein